MSTTSRNSFFKTRRRRCGTTSPPLINIHPNPGPKCAAARRRLPSGRKTVPSQRLTNAQSQEIIARLKAREPFEAIARAVGCRIESVKLRATSLKQNGTVELHSPGAKPKSQRHKRDVDADIDSERHAKRVRRLDEREKGLLCPR